MRTFLILAALLTSAAAHAQDTLAHIKATGHLRCGVIAQQPDFEKRDTHGNIAAFATDLCRAVAASLPGGVAGLQLQGEPDTPHALAALQAGKLDLVYGVTPSPDWAAKYDVAYGEPVFFDGQAVMVPNALAGAGLPGLAGRQICFIGNTGIETTLTAALRQRNIPFKPFPFQETGEMEAALVTGHCQAETADASALAADRAGFHARQRDFAILPDRLTLDPYVPALPANDTAWVNAVNAVQFSLIRAEQDGITQADAARQGDVAAASVTAVGNYGEIFERDLGTRSPLRLSRGPNRPWTQGGLLWAPPE